MKGKKVLSFLLAVFLVAGLASQSLAWGRGPRKGKFNHEKIQKMIGKKLDLTEEQQKQFKTHGDQMKKEREAHKEEMKAVGDKIKAELEKDNPNRRILHNLVRRASQKRTAMEIKRMDSLLDLRKTLTPEQREKFKEMTKRRDKRGPGGSPRPW